jgi:UDP-N-acetylglucosamine pyrophosphorylase
MNVVKKQFPDSPFTNQNMIKWYIMTSEMNNDEVIGFFKQHKYFGYDPESIVFFPQGGIPALDY